MKRYQISIEKGNCFRSGLERDTMKEAHEYTMYLLDKNENSIVVILDLETMNEDYYTNNEDLLQNCIDDIFRQTARTPRTVYGGNGYWHVNM